MYICERRHFRAKRRGCIHRHQRFRVGDQEEDSWRQLCLGSAPAVQQQLYFFTHVGRHRWRWRLCRLLLSAACLRVAFQTRRHSSSLRLLRANRTVHCRRERQHRHGILDEFRDRRRNRLSDQEQMDLGFRLSTLRVSYDPARNQYPSRPDLQSRLFANANSSVAEGHTLAIRVGWVDSRTAVVGSLPLVARQMSSSQPKRRAWASSYSRNSRTRPQSRDIPFRFWAVSRSETREGKMKSRVKWNVVAAACALLAAGVAASAEPEKVESQVSSEGPAAAKQEELEMLAKLAQNPVANVVSVPFQNNTNFGNGPPNNKGSTQNVLNIQPVVPITLSHDWNLITRTIIPLVSQPSFTPGGSGSFGLSNINFTAFLSPANPGKLIWGVGPVATFPTATSVNVGSQSTWGLGPSAVLLAMPGHWVLGVLANNVWNIAGDRANNMLIQYFINYNLPDGWYVTTSPIITANWNQPSGQKWV